MILVSLKIMVRKYSSGIYSSSFNNFPVLAWFVEPVGRCAFALQLTIGVWQQTAPAIWMLTTDKSFGAAICQFNSLSSLVLIKLQLLCMIPEKIMVYLKPSCLVLSCTWWRYPQLVFQLQLERCLPFHMQNLFAAKSLSGYGWALIYLLSANLALQLFLGQEELHPRTAVPDVFHHRSA